MRHLMTLCKQLLQIVNADTLDITTLNCGILLALYTYQEVRMFKVMKQKDLIKEVEKSGFILIRNSDHKVYKKNEHTIIIPHSKTVSSGMVHQTYKVLKKAA